MQGKSVSSLAAWTSPSLSACQNRRSHSRSCFSRVLSVCMATSFSSSGPNSSAPGVPPAESAGRRLEMLARVQAGGVLHVDGAILVVVDAVAAAGPLGAVGRVVTAGVGGRGSDGVEGGVDQTVAVVVDPVVAVHQLGVVEGREAAGVGLVGVGVIVVVAAVAAGGRVAVVAGAVHVVIALRRVADGGAVVLDVVDPIAVGIAARRHALTGHADLADRAGAAAVFPAAVD